MFSSIICSAFVVLEGVSLDHE